MIRKLFAIVLFGFGCSLTLGADDPPGADDKKAGKDGGVDRAKLFAKMDVNRDGKVTKEEFTKVFDALLTKLKESGKGGKLTGKGGNISAKLFERLDTNGDGFLTKEEFEKGKLGGPNGGGAFKGKGGLKGKD
jgi:hypothetical protein